MESSAAIEADDAADLASRRRSQRRTRQRLLELLPDTSILEGDHCGLWGMAEVAAELDVTVSNLHHIKDLPEHVMRCRATRLWLPDEIREFAEVYRARRPASRA